MIRAVKMQFTAQYAKGEITYFEFYPMIRGRPLSQIMIEHIYDLLESDRLFLHFGPILHLESWIWS
jgi:hypothetical protein